MKHRTFLAGTKVPAIILAPLLAGACGGDEPAAVAALEGEYRAERTTEGSVTTVRHISGSKWNGRASFEDREERLWVGTYGGGLNLFEDGEW